MNIDALIKFLEELRDENPDINIIKGNISWDVYENGEYVDTEEFEL